MLKSIKTFTNHKKRDIMFECVLLSEQADLYINLKEKNVKINRTLQKAQKEEEKEDSFFVCTTSHVKRNINEKLYKRVNSDSIGGVLF